MNWRWTRAVAVGALGLTALLGCAEERDPINRVQANALAKSFFVGEDLQNDADNPKFYANGTLLDIGYGASLGGVFSALYAMDLSIVRWEITEDLLNGRLAYERIADSDGQGAGLEAVDGQIVYSFKILSHFDIRHAYNSATGEELNVIEENASDRPWYLREYMRVDWSQNLQTDIFDFDNLSFYQYYEGWELTPVAYYVNDPNDAHAPHFDAEDGYFDITNKVYASPMMVDLSFWGYGAFPACWFDSDIAGGTYPAGNCNPVEITTRHSFHRVDDNDYEPSNWDGYKFQAFGAFVKERFGWDDAYRMSDHKWWRFISRYNIWERSHYYDDLESMTGQVPCYTPGTTPVGADPERDVDNDGTHDECWQVSIKLGMKKEMCSADTLGQDANAEVPVCQDIRDISCAEDQNPAACEQWKQDSCCYRIANPTVGGSRCDKFKNRCTLPFSQRKVRPIVQYYSKGSDQRFWEATWEGTQQFDAAIRMAVLAARNAECYRIHGVDCELNQPAIHGQMTMSQDLIDIIREVDTCNRRNGWGQDCTDPTNPNSIGLEAMMQARGYADMDWHGMWRGATMDKTVVLCHSPIEANDHPSCAPGRTRLPAGITAELCHVHWLDGGDPSIRAACNQAYAVRIGDVRYHLVNVFEDPATPSPWGFGPTYSDPTTGEAISASVNVWAWPTDYIAQSTVDISRFIAGELAVEDVTDGTYIKDWVKAADLAGNGIGALPRMTRAEREDRLDQVMRGFTRNLQTGETPEVNQVDPDELQQQLSATQLAKLEKLAKGLKAVEADAFAPSEMATVYASRLAQARGTPTEASLVTKAMKQYAGVESMPGEVALELASPLRGMVNPTLQRQVAQMREHMLADHNACMLFADDYAPSPTAMIGLTKVLQEKFGQFNPEDDQVTQIDRVKRMADWLGRRMHYSVVVHEMGHTYGLRHNFVSSSNAFNFRPQYWQLRTRNGQVTTPCYDLTESDDEAANCVGPRYFDQITPEERDNMIWTWHASSIMDYGGDYTQDLLGLGVWDFAAAKMFYGETATMFQDADLKEGTPLSGAITETILDNFGGIIGYKYQSAPSAFPVSNNIHYSQLNSTYQLLNSCANIPDINMFKPAGWDDAKDGIWSPLGAAQIVKVDGQYSRCRQRRVDYVHWNDLRRPLVGINNYRNPPAIDIHQQRTRVPYGFGTDRWADLGNLSVYRHDNGADAYELFDFFITEQEVRHIFDNYRRGRQGFSVRSASDRILTRYNTKMRDGAKGMGLIKNNILGAATTDGFIPEGYFAALVAYWGVEDNMLAAGQAFDHFARQLARPNSGPHFDPGGGITTVLRWSDFEAPNLIVPDGAQGFWNTVGMGGKPVNNSLADDQGEYDSEYTMNAGSYYDKLHTTMLLTESVDNFISDSLDDFVDARYRSVSIADMFPDGYRRWLANNLTGDDYLKGPRVAATPAGNPDVISPSDRYPKYPLGWTSWWPDSPEICFSNTGTMICSAYGMNGQAFKPYVPPNSRAIDPQIGWEQHKFLIAWTLVYLPENQKQTWLDMMNIWNIGADTDPGFSNRIELHVPTGDVYVARTYGTEQLCFEECKTVQRGIAARILEYANELLAQAYVTTPVTQGDTTWHVPVMGSNGQPIIRFDPNLDWINPNFTYGQPPDDCNYDPDPTDNDYSTFEGCVCTYNASCMVLQNYLSVPDFMRQAMRDFGLADPSMKGVYGP